MSLVLMMLQEELPDDCTFTKDHFDIRLSAETMVEQEVENLIVCVVEL